VNLQTQFPFTLPKGYVDSDGTLHRKGVMRLATARDEIEPLRDLRVQENDAYLTVVMLSRVLTELGTITMVTPNIVEGLFAVDLAYLQELYGIINFGDPSALADLEAAYHHPLPEPEPLPVTNGNGSETVEEVAQPVLAGRVVRRAGMG
jgi:hypothetical protein